MTETPSQKPKYRSATLPRWLCGAALATIGWAWSTPSQAQPNTDDRGTGAIPGGSSGAIVKKEDQPSAQPPKPQVIPPKLVRFQEPPFPKEALDAGIVSGTVKVKVTVNKEGQVTAAEVLTPIGHGFDEAARAAVLAGEWQPATRGGVPVAAVTLIAYEFKAPKPEEVAAPPPVVAAPKTGQLTGILKIEGGDAPLAGAELLIRDAAGTERRLTSDAQGRFKLEDLPPGKYTVQVSLSGFTSVQNIEEVAAGDSTDITYRLAPEVDGLEVVVKGERPPREVTRRTVEQREIDRIPGTRGDAIRAIENFPGVARPPGLAGILIVRGSAPNDTVTFVDGVGVPLIYHFGGLSSVIPTELLDRIDFYPGNFSSKYGRVMGGVVDVGLRSPNTQCNGPYATPSDKKGCYHGLRQLDLIDGRMLLEGPLPFAKKWTFAVAARRSWFDTWLKPVLEATGAGVTNAPVYYDYQGILETKPSATSKLSIRAFGSNDRLELLIKDPLAAEPGVGGNIRFSSGSHLGQMIYTDKLSQNVDLYSMVSFGKQTLEFGLGALHFSVDSYPLSYRSEIGWKLASGIKINSGLDFQFIPFDVSVRAPSPPREGQPDPGPLSSLPLLEQNISSSAFRPGWYVEGEITPTRRTRVVPGLRVDYSRDTGHADFSPRLNARYDIVSPTQDGSAEHPAKRTTLKAGVGYYYQPPEFQETSKVFGTPNLLSNRALHYGVGIEQEISRHIEASVEGFYKDMNRLVSSSAASTSFGYANNGLGHVIGLETLIKYKPDRRFFGWVAYTLSRSVRQDNEQAPERLFQYDQTHILTVLGSYRIGRGWEMGARFRLVSGNLYTPLQSSPAISALYAADAGTFIAQSGAPFSKRLPPFHALDIRFDKRWQFRKWRFSTYLDIQNAYNHPAVEALTYNYNFSKSGYQTGLPILPSIGMRGEF